MISKDSIIAMIGGYVCAIIGFVLGINYYNLGA